MLTDWDLALKTNQAHQISRPGRTGTWQFISAQLLNSPNSRQTLVDDRESALYVLLYVTLLYLPHGAVPALAKWASMFDESFHDSEDVATGGQKKVLFLQGSTRPFKVLPFADHRALNSIIGFLRTEFALRYPHNTKANNPLKANREEPAPVVDNTKQIKVLQMEDWLVQTLEKALDLGPEYWPTSVSRVERHEIPGVQPEKKRKRDANALNRRSANKLSKSSQGASVTSECTGGEESETDDEPV